MVQNMESRLRNFFALWGVDDKAEQVPGLVAQVRVLQSPIPAISPSLQRIMLTVTVASWYAALRRTHPHIRSIACSLIHIYRLLEFVRW
jgi:hypothetical protein